MLAATGMSVRTVGAIINRPPQGYAELMTTRASEAGAEDSQNIINNILIKIFRGTTHGTVKNLVCLLFT